MAPSKKGKGNDTSGVQSKSPAEFFAENQNIAGFDSLGRSLYTTVREFVENSLDAAESIEVLPSVEISITELSKESFAKLRSISVNLTRENDALFKQKAPAKKKASKKIDATTGDEEIVEQAPTANSKEGFFKVVCRDNGCGMPHTKIPDMFGRVLSGSKYGVKQARGKFGLGAKMALIWSKKSTGLPIEIKTAHVPRKGCEPPATMSYCSLDIDILKNEPNVYEHKRLPNTDGWHGSEVSVIISGSWSSYRARIISYIQQLAVITPYASFKLKYDCEQNKKKSFEYEYKRRSENIAKAPKEVKHHPKSVDNLLVKQLIRKSRCTTIASFLQHGLSSINAELARTIVTEYSTQLKRDMSKVNPNDLEVKEVHQLTQLLKDVTKYPDPSADCLSPAGEYNLRIGVKKEFNPTLVATATAKPSAYNGHPFLVEAAVALGSGQNNKPGFQIYRFANRIPLLFEGGSDVATVTAKTKINWGKYKMNYKTDRIAVFVSIVSTKIPFKGTGKEYIGHDIEEIRERVFEAICACCKQLKIKLQEKNAAQSQADRIKSLAKSVPNVSVALRAMVDMMLAVRHNERYEEEDVIPTVRGTVPPEKKARVADIESSLDLEALTVPKIEEKLLEKIQCEHQNQALAKIKATSRGHAERKAFTLNTAPLDLLKNDSQVFHHELFTLRLQNDCQS